MAIDRRTVLVGGAAAAVSPWLGAKPASAQQQEALLWQEFVRAPYTHPQIPNVSFAGYRYGEQPHPLPVRANVLHYGATPDASTDSAPAINRAIVDVGETGGGVVLVPEGRYRIDDIIQVGYDNVVLRGAGSAETTLYATRSLEQLVGINRSRYGSENSAWSWCGALVWVCHRDRYRDLIGAIRTHDWPLEGWLGNEGDVGTVIASVTAPAARGDFVLTLDDASNLTPGQRVMLQVDDDAEYGLLRHMCGDVPGTATYIWSDKTKLLSYPPFQWPVRVAAVDGSRVTLDQALPVDARTGWNARLTTFAPAVVGSGVEKLTIRMVKTVRPRHLQDKGYNGLVFQCAWDCWADDVIVVDSDNGFLLVSAKNVTMRRTGVVGRGQHHSYACREQSHDNLIEDFFIGTFTEAPTPGSAHHGINVEGLSCGNVWSQGQMEAGTFDTHRGLPFANVRTEVVIYNDGAHGGSADAGPLYGARFTHWNVTVTNNRAGCVRIDHVAPCSATVGISEVQEFGQIDKPDFAGDLRSRLESDGDPAVRPVNLHLAQRRLREVGQPPEARP